jgi:hypothetical protein
MKMVEHGKIARATADSRQKGHFRILLLPTALSSDMSRLFEGDVDPRVHPLFP